MKLTTIYLREEKDVEKNLTENERQNNLLSEITKKYLQTDVDLQVFNVESGYSVWTVQATD